MKTRIRRMANKAYVLKRLIAYGIDFYLVGVLTAFSYTYFEMVLNKTEEVTLNVENMTSTSSLAASLVSLLLVMLYLVVLTKKLNGTLGQRICGLKLVNTKNEEVNVKALIIRYLAYIFVFTSIYSISKFIYQSIGVIINVDVWSVVLVIGRVLTIVNFMYALISKDTRTVIDVLSNTKVELRG